MCDKLLEFAKHLASLNSLEHGDNIPAELLNDIKQTADTIAVSAIVLPTNDIAGYTALNGRLIPIDNSKKYPTHKATLEESVKLLKEADNLPRDNSLSWRVSDRLTHSRVMQKIILYSSGHSVLDYEYGNGDNNLANCKGFNTITHNLKHLRISVVRVESRNGKQHFYCDCVALYQHAIGYTEEKNINKDIYNATTHKIKISKDNYRIVNNTGITDSGRLILTHFNPSELAIYLWLSGNELRPDLLPFTVDIIGRFRGYDATQYLNELKKAIAQRKAEKLKRKTWRDNWRKVNRTTSQVRLDNKNKMIVRAIKQGDIELANHIATLPLTYTCFR